MNIITSIPYTIPSPGVWKLGASLDMASTADAPAIVLGCDDIILRGGDEWLINSGGFGGKSTGIYGLNRSRCVIEGFQIFGSGFKYAIHLENTDGFASEGKNVIADNKRLSSNFRAIRNESKQAKILRNIVRGVGGGSWQSGLYCFGIEHFGADSLISGNVVEDVYGDTVNAGESVGLSVTRFSSRTFVVGNHIKNINKVGYSMALWSGDQQENVRFLDNTIENYKRALFGTTEVGVADGNRVFNVGPLAGEAPHDMFDIPGLDWWTGNNMGT